MRRFPFAAISAVALLVAAGSTSTVAQDYPSAWCLQGKTGAIRANASLDLQSMLGTASGTFSYCGINPLLAFAHHGEVIGRGNGWSPSRAYEGIRVQRSCWPRRGSRRRTRRARRCAGARGGMALTFMLSPVRAYQTSGHLLVAVPDAFIIIDPTSGVTHLPTQFAALSSHRIAPASAGEWSTPVPMRVIRRKGAVSWSNLLSLDLHAPVICSSCLPRPQSGKQDDECSHAEHVKWYAPYFCWRSSGSVDLDHVVLRPDRAIDRRRRYHLATRHRALPGPNSPLVSSRISKCRHVGLMAQVRAAPDRRVYRRTRAHSRHPQDPSLGTLQRARTACVHMAT